MALVPFSAKSNRLNFIPAISHHLAEIWYAVNCNGKTVEEVDPCHCSAASFCLSAPHPWGLLLFLPRHTVKRFQAQQEEEARLNPSFCGFHAVRLAEFGRLGNLDTDLASYVYAYYNMGSSVTFYSKHKTVYISSTSSSKCLVLCSYIK